MPGSAASGDGGIETKENWRKVEYSYKNGAERKSAPFRAYFSPIYMQ